jgi:hypothetical protein
LSVIQNHNKFLNLRQKYQTFEYQSYSFKVNNGILEAEFNFKLGDDIIFTPTIKVVKHNFYQFDSLSESLLKNLVFHIGMVELISYWKAACPPRLVIKPHALSDEQVLFWKKLYFNGLGEFFYLNGISATQDEFMKIVSEGDALNAEPAVVNDKAVMVPVGGGKDSVVTLELLKEQGNRVIPMAMNPREAVVRTIENAGFVMNDAIVVERKLDKKLLELNSRGFLNGHTPFSALLAFVTSLTAVMAGIKYIALSNESSANESTVPGSNINHQYSKSFEFEEDFSNYLSRFITPDVHYFSFLRPLNELQIGALFSLFSRHHFSFRSCNVGSKTDSWCGHCPKCLFTRIILGPFLGNDKLKKVFGKELLDTKGLKPVFDELTGAADVKPFECVGTPDEVNAALSFIARNSVEPLPFLLSDFPFDKFPEDSLMTLLAEFNPEHHLPEKYLTVLKNSLKKIAMS